MTLLVARYGYTSDGGSNQNPQGDELYCVPVTVTEAGLAVAIEAHVQGGTLQPSAALMADNAGDPGQIIACFSTSASSPITSATVRRFTIPIPVWVDAATYWAGFQAISGAGAGQLRYAAGAAGDTRVSDGNVISTLVEPGTAGAAAPADSDRRFSIQLVVLQTTGAPTPPGGGGTPAEGNRIGDVGAIRKPPRG